MEFLLYLPILLLAIVVHEVAHAWQARREGDPTAERLGRITLNPIPHLDPVGSFAVPLLLWFGPMLLGGSTGGFIFGWAKPVPVNPANYRDYKGGDIRVSLAGIVSNFAQAILFTLIAAGIAPLADQPGVFSVLFSVARFGIFINLILAIFNLIPIPPLDGSHVLYHLLPARARPRYREMGRYGLGIIMLLVFFVPGFFSILLEPVYFFMGLADAFIRLWT
jgi:Zn-dependent protease